MKEPFDIWWYGGLLVPISITVFVGGPIAIWIGVFVARLVAFDQAKMTAVSVLGELAALPNYDSWDSMQKGKLSIATRLNTISSEYLRLRQLYAFGMLKYLGSRVIAAPWEDSQKSMSFPLSEKVRDELFAKLEPYGGAFARMVFNLKPKVYPLITLQRQADAAFRGKIPTAPYPVAEDSALKEYRLGGGQEN